MSDRTEFAREWVFGPEREGVERPVPDQRLVDAICDADDTRPIAGIDRPAWGSLSANDRMELARFAVFLKVAPQLYVIDPERGETS